MSKLPVRRQQFQTAEFAAWLAEQGAEVGTPTNMYEVIRYRAYHDGSAKAVTHIVYAKETGLLTFTGGSQSHYLQFVTGCQLYPQTPPSKKAVLGFPPSPVEPVSKAAKTRAKLLGRDGDECWFCGTAMGDDCTIEHLVPKSRGGGNKLDNYALAHAACNQRAANMPLVKKIALRAEMRGQSLAILDLERGL